MSHGSVWRFGSLSNCQFSLYVGSGYLRAGSGVGVWAVAGEAARTADVTRTKMKRENISALLHERLRRGHAARHPVFDARIQDSSAENCQESLRTLASKSSWRDIVGNIALAKTRACRVVAAFRSQRTSAN